ncbi:MAG: CHASE2 domain-containing protein, partial [Elusimicrobia bacterium]|nr:CHASE2 domain-containing protein [Elusimicrobiota bacterium]
MRQSLARRAGRGTRWLIPLAALLGCLAVRLSGWSWVEGVQYRAFDAFLNMAPRPYQDVPVRVIDIDEDSLAKVGQFPWPRTKVAELVTRLNALGAAVIAFDITFPEPDRTSPRHIVTLWPDDPALKDIKTRVARLPDHDERLAKAFRSARVVAGFAPGNEARARVPQAKTTFAFGGDGPLSYLHEYPGATDNLPILDAAAAGLGSFGFLGEHDGILRRAPMLFNVAGKLFPSLSLEALRVAQGAANVSVKSSGASGETAYGAHTGISKLKVGQFIIPT